MGNAIALAPDHPDHGRWRLAVGLAYAERGRRHESLDDYHTAIDRLSRLYVDTGLSHDLRVRVAAELGDLCWARLWIVRFQPRVDARRALAEVDRLLARIDPLQAAPDEPEDLTDIRLVVGLARLARYALNGQRRDLGRGIDALLTASMWHLPPDDLRRCQAGSELVEALRLAGEVDPGTDALERSVATARRILDGAGPADGTAWFLLNRYTASAAYELWRERGVPADLELAHQCWQPLLPDGLDPDSAREYRALLADWRRI